MRLLALLILLISACSSDDFTKILEKAPDAGPIVYDNSESYNLALGSYRDSSVIKYCLVENAPLLTYEETVALVEDAVTMWGNIINKPFVQVDSINEANIYFTFEFLDGTGGLLGFAEYPPYFQVKNWNRNITLDKYDIHGDTDLDIVTIIAHEVGHALGIKHSEDPASLMFDQYTGHKPLSLDDNFGARILYNNKKKFYFNQRAYIPIENNEDKISNNFLMKEFFSRCTSFDDDFHFLDENLVYAIQEIRNYYGQPIQIISSYRSYECNIEAGGALASKHKEAQALDFRFIGPKARETYHRFMEDITSQNCIFQLLLNIGIGGFGAYNTAFHIDTRNTGLHSFFDRSYGLWGKFVEDSYITDPEHPWGIDD
ncbi:MAG TPA: matrixin family metalloprotease [Tissierellaceae bacterium]|nr:matrixin family metalloprotease [Tissierellaceae bacterium]